MSKYTKGDGTNTNNQPVVVTPSNIGKGIKWNSNTNKYEVAISNVDNNAIELKQDGLFYNNRYSGEILLYVSNQGSDTTGDGSKQSPFGTIDYAFAVGSASKANTVVVAVKEAQTFTVNNKSINASNGKHFVITPYSDAIDDLGPDYQHNLFMVTDRYPIIKWNGVDTKQFYIAKFTATNAGFTIRACILDLDMKNTGRSFAWIGGNNGQIGINNCAFRLSNTNRADQCYIRVAGYPTLFYLTNTLFIDNRHTKTPTDIVSVSNGDVYSFTVDTEIVGNKPLLRTIMRQGQNYTTGIVRHNGIPINILSNVLL